MRKFNPREKEFLKLLERISNEDLEFFSFFMQREFFTSSSNLALIVVSQQSSALLFIKKVIFDDLPSRKEEIRKFIEILSLTEYLKQTRLIDLIPNPTAQEISMHLMREDFDTPNQATPTSNIILNGNGLHFKYPDLSKIYNSQNEIVFEAVKLEKYTYELIMNNLMGLLFVSEDLRDYVQKGFRSTDDIRYRNGQIATWVSISIAFLFGLIGIYNPFHKDFDKNHPIDAQKFDSLVIQNNKLNSNMEKIFLKLRKQQSDTLTRD